MRKLTKYEEIIGEYEHNVDVIEYSFRSNNIKGLYSNGVVAINNKLSTTEKTGTIAEELGHHHTSSGDILDMDSTSNRKQELRARVWAYYKLINLQGFIDAFEHHCTNMYETAEFLDVTEEFLVDSINAYMHKYGCYIKYKNYVIEFGFNSVNVIKQYN